MSRPFLSLLDPCLATASGPPPAPTNTVAPVASGVVRIGGTLATTDGTWTGAPTSYTYQWRRITSGTPANIATATASTYAAVAADVVFGVTVDCVVTAHNAGGTAAQDSNDLVFDQALLPTATLRIDHRLTSPQDGAYCTIIEKNDTGARGYANVLSSCGLEKGRLFGQPRLYWRPLADLVRGWRVIRCKHDNSGHGGLGSGRSLLLTNYNGVNTELLGVLDNSIDGTVASKPTTGVTFEIPDLTTLVHDEGLDLYGSNGATYNFYALWDSGTTFYLYFLFQGASGSVTHFINLSAAGAVTGTLVTVSGFYDGTNVQHEVLINGVYTQSPATAIDAMSRVQTNYQTSIGGGAAGLSCYEGNIFAVDTQSSTTAVSQTDRRVGMAWDQAQYLSTTVQTWADGPPILAPDDNVDTTAFRGTTAAAHLRVYQGARTESGGFADSVVNAGLAGGTFDGATTTRPAATTMPGPGALPAQSYDGVDDVLVLTGKVESDCFPDLTQFTVIGAAKVKPSDQVTGLGGGALGHGDSGLTIGNVYQGGDGLSRGVTPRYVSTGGLHGAGDTFATLNGGMEDGSVEDVVSYVLTQDPHYHIDGSTCVVRGMTRGLQASDYSNDRVGTQSGALKIGKNVANFGKFTGPIPAVYDVAASQLTQQRIYRWYQTQIGNV